MCRKNKTCPARNMCWRPRIVASRVSRLSCCAFVSVCQISRLHRSKSERGTQLPGSTERCALCGMATRSTPTSCKQQLHRRTRRMSRLCHDCQSAQASHTAGRVDKSTQLASARPTVVRWTTCFSSSRAFRLCTSLSTPPLASKTRISSDLAPSSAASTKRPRGKAGEKLKLQIRSSPTGMSLATCAQV